MLARYTALVLYALELEGLTLLFKMKQQHTQISQQKFYFDIFLYHIKYCT